MSSINDHLTRLLALFERSDSWIRHADAGYDPDDEDEHYSYRSWGDQKGDQPEARPFTCFCLRGGVFQVAPSAEVARDMLLALANTINPENSEPHSTVTQWNDMGGRTRGEVLDLIKRTIACKS